jgi:Zn-dependent peptidase ImmA (M78 family)
MNKSKLESIERRAEKLLRDSRAWRVPIPIERVSDKLNLATYASAQGEGISGVLVVEGKRGAVGYNPTHPLVRRRYTIAHEIGHYVMHVKASAQQSLFVDRYVAFRDDQSSEGKDWQEVEANAFAAALLMPELLVREEIRKQGFDLDDEDDLSSLAKNFRVSTSAMSYRLVNLGLLRYA